FFSSRRRHTRFSRDWSSDVCSSDISHRQRDLDDQHPLYRPRHRARNLRCGNCYTRWPVPTRGGRHANPGRSNRDDHGGGRHRPVARRRVRGPAPARLRPRPRGVLRARACRRRHRADRARLHERHRRRYSREPGRGLQVVRRRGARRRRLRGPAARYPGRPHERRGDRRGQGARRGLYAPLKERNMFDTTIAGSLPKPSWLAEPEKLWATWRLSGSELESAKRDAALVWLKEQDDAGIDIVTNGEQFRVHFVHGFLRSVEGIDWQRMTKMGIRDNRYMADVPTVTGPVRRTGSVHGEEARFTRAHARGRLKFT